MSNDGGTDPLWADEGRTLFHSNPTATRLLAVPVSRNPTLNFGAPAPRDGWWAGAIPYGRNHDITPEGPEGRRLIMVSVSETAGNEIAIVKNWFEELKQKLAARRPGARRRETPAFHFTEETSRFILSMDRFGPTPSLAQSQIY